MTERGTAGEKEANHILLGKCVRKTRQVTERVGVEERER